MSKSKIPNAIIQFKLDLKNIYGKDQTEQVKGEAIAIRYCIRYLERLNKGEINNE